MREADATWARLADAYRDERDLAAQPYGLVAALERPAAGPRDAVIQAGYSDLVAGRWALAVDQVDYFLPLLEARLGRPAAERPSTAFLAEQRLASALRDSTASLATPAAGEVAWTTIGSNPAYRLALAASADGVAGCVIRTDWVAERVLPDAARSLGVDRSLSVVLEPRTAPVSPPPQGAVLLRQALPLALAGHRLAARVTAPPPARDADWAFAGATVVTMGALAIGVLLLLRDVARQRETNRVREDLVSGVSHELKTPLTLIRVYAETLAADPAAAEDDRRSYYEVIVRETERLSGLIERVLNFSRVDRGERSYRFAPADLRTVVGETTATYTQFLRGRGFGVEVDIAPGVRMVTCDADAVAEALVNLLDNAAKYSGDARGFVVRLR